MVVPPSLNALPYRFLKRLYYKGTRNVMYTQVIRSKEHGLLQPDMTVPNTLTTRLQVHHGYGKN